MSYPSQGREEKPPQAPEKSLGYISWSLKEISECLKKITAMMEADRNGPGSSNTPF